MVRSLARVVLWLVIVVGALAAVVLLAAAVIPSDATRDERLGAVIVGFVTLAVAVGAWFGQRALRAPGRSTGARAPLAADEATPRPAAEIPPDEDALTARPPRRRRDEVIAEKPDYELTEAESSLLLAATREALAAAGALGGGKGGAAGGRFAARFTAAKTAAASVEVSAEPEAVRQRARSAIAQTGVVIEDPNADGDGSVWGIVDSGWMDMAPALLRVGVEATERGRSRVNVRATGREGLVKQKIAVKAVDRIVEAIVASPSARATTDAGRQPRRRRHDRP